ncbi:nucleotidyl transferase AbiEii/AbiGii toxin family protein [Jiangella muralis]|uniref:nucleotidyl transferase AbiEii/AbiGii toxin family protein n=1 Tax=Jiangella muralis TaxID=702383 RepID=UPI00069EB085|nr:nucleotidyl transferase AbiEii/AbiGii toxin family protein [Jiangella muralis]
MAGADEHQRHIARLLLSAIGDAGFALAGATAIREHGLTNRPTQDVDLFAASSTTAEQFKAALTRAEGVLRERGYQVRRHRSSPLFARLVVEDHAGVGLEVDLGVDWRQDPPVQLSVGPVLSIRDAVAAKIGAVYSRGEARDFLDLDAIRESGRFTDEELLQLARDHDDGFDARMFAAQLDRISHIHTDEVSEYGVDVSALEGIARRLQVWATSLQDG